MESVLKTPGFSPPSPKRNRSFAVKGAEISAEASFWAGRIGGLVFIFAGITLGIITGSLFFKGVPKYPYRYKTLRAKIVAPYHNEILQSFSIHFVTVTSSFFLIDDPVRQVHACRRDRSSHASGESTDHR